jgi:uncharacterized protein
MVSDYSLCIFTRYPEPGAVKTRLIESLGPEQAADLHDWLSRYTLRQARRLKKTTPVQLAVHYHGGDLNRMRRWLGDDLTYVAQQGEDLGDRMASACSQAEMDKALPVVIIGTDCPGLRADLIQTAFIQLQNSDLVLGPAKDGGYYLIGMSRPGTALFSGIHWGSGQVLAETLQIARSLALSVFLLPELADVDRPEDLVLVPPDWRGCVDLFSRRIMPKESS